MKPLENKIIISTRPLANDDTMKKSLIEKGATVLDFPMIKIVTNELNDEIRPALANINTFQWLLFTSKNGVNSFFGMYKNNYGEIAVLQPKIAVIGQATANEVLKNGYNPEFISTGNTSEDFIGELKTKLRPDDPVLVIQGELADTKFEKNLISGTRLNVYKTVETTSHSIEIINRIKANDYDMLVFTSPSGFRNFAKIMDENNCNGNFKIACIGKTTEKEVLNQGYTPLIVSKKPGGDSFADEIENYFTK
jgi:Uroporphyrinogen-III synthase